MNRGAVTDSAGRMPKSIRLSEQLEGHLVLVVAAGHADGEHGPAVLEDERRA